MTDEALRCFVLWCRLNPALDDPALLRRVFEAYCNISALKEAV